MSLPSIKDVVTQLLCLLVLILLAGCDQEALPGWQGYAEGEYLYVAVACRGRLLKLAVHKEETVAAGALLFRLDPETESIGVADARKRLEEVGFSRDDLATGQTQRDRSPAGSA